ncbi:MAG: (Fe-S)-binding protein, partial [Planctomycetia bacterium]
LVAGSAGAMRWAGVAPWLYNIAVTAPGISWLLKRGMGFATRRSLPELPDTTLASWYRRHRHGRPRPPAPLGRGYLVCDEFTDTLDAPIGIKAVELLEALGYEVVIPAHVDSGRAHFSKGLVREARDLAVRNVERLAPVITDDAPLVGIEPSAILGFRDEYPDIVPEWLAESARALAKRTLLIDEFLAREVERGRIGPERFTQEHRRVLLHGHCHQKALSSLAPTVAMLGLPANSTVEVIPSGCCGMAGSFGYEAEHFDLSMQIGELVLFPAVRQAGSLLV